MQIIACGILSRRGCNMLHIWHLKWQMADWNCAKWGPGKQWLTCEDMG